MSAELPGRGVHVPMTKRMVFSLRLSYRAYVARWRTIAVICAFAAGMFGCGFDETPEDGLRAFDRGNYSEAERIWGGLAQNGNATAQFTLGRMYELGVGVVQNYDTASHWYRKAAIRSNPYAQGNLAVLYAHGRGVPQDFVQSYVWSTLAAAGYSNWSGNLRNTALRNRDIVAVRMNASDMSAAQRQLEKLALEVNP